MNAELSDEERVRLTCLVMAIFDEWHLAGEERVVLLGLPEATRPRQLARYRGGGVALPAQEDLLDRARDIVGIHHALYLLFPRNPYMPLAWLTDPDNRRFGGEPLRIMLVGGRQGIREVRAHLECNEPW